MPTPQSTQTLPTSAPAERNKGLILAVLERVLPASGLVLEIASGTGQHVVHFASALPKLAWQPSEVDAEVREVITARVAAHGLDNVRAPLAVDVMTWPWPVAAAEAILCINMIHISPWAATEGLMRGAGALLAPGAPLILYGPYRRHGEHTAPSNAAFDESLKARNAQWGVRDLEAVEQAAQSNGLTLAEAVTMPANNFVVVLRRG
jgi:Protein of unknown function (DUF938)